MAKLFTNEYHLVGTYTSNLRLGKTIIYKFPEGSEAVGDTHRGYETHREVMRAAEQMRTRGFKVYVYEMNPIPIYEAEGLKPEPEPEPDNWHEDDHHGESLSDHYYEELCYE